MAESFDAVLAEMREWADRYESNGSAALATNLREYASRLQAAHEREVWELQSEADRRTREVELTYLVQKRLTNRADRAVGLLREVSRGGWGKLGPADLIHETPLLERIDAFLSEQAGERENGDG